MGGQDSWASVGTGAAGGDLSLVVPSPFFRMEADVSHLSEHVELAYEGCVQGLREAGWRGDPRAVRLGYTIAVALRTASIALTLRALLDTQAQLFYEQRWGHPLEALLAQRAPLTQFLLDCADEARALPSGS